MDRKNIQFESEPFIPSLIQIQPMKKPLSISENVNTFSIKNAPKKAPIANLVVHTNSNSNEKIMQKLEFMPHFDKNIYDFMIPEGSNKVVLFRIN